MQTTTTIYLVFWHEYMVSLKLRTKGSPTKVNNGGRCKSANSRINIVKKKNNFRMSVKIIEMEIFSYVFEEL